MSDTVTCSCGTELPFSGPEFDAHFIFARYPATKRKSNLGNCPKFDGWEAAALKTSQSFGINPVEWQGEWFDPRDPKTWPADAAKFAEPMLR